ncbi:thermonuclease family protein [Rhizobium mongolense]|uniref:thermonuclease family protein n=1 Tax=Rhizobium mongolense TaxID=57676 RepID=UPI003557BFBD
MNKLTLLLTSLLMPIHILVPSPSQAKADFPLCGHGKRHQCIVDGDTFWHQGTKYRLYAIDAPEVGGGAKCQQEYDSGMKATYLLQSLLQSGITSMTQHGLDRYGRILVSVQTRDGDASGQILQAGLAEPFGQRVRADWCSKS